MKFRKLKAIAVCSGMLLSFAYGVITVQYKIFPFEQLRAIEQIASPSQGPEYSDYFYHKKSFFEQHGRRNYDVVLIGDSLTDYAEWNDLFPSLEIANHGISGDRTDGVLKRINTIYSTSADRAFIMIGINDFFSGMSVDEVFANYFSIVMKLSEKGMKIFVQSTILAGEGHEEVNIKIKELNKRLELLAIKNDSITYIDLNAGLAKNLFLNPMYSRDKVHLNGHGYAVWKRIVRPYVQ